MPFTALVWNVERLGTKFSRSNAALLMEDVRSQLVASVAAAAQADVLVLQELRQQGVPLLKQLLRELNVRASGRGAWHYDWLPGSQTTAVGTPTLFDQLGFTQTGNNEGYAAVWREGALVPFAGSTLSAGIDTPDPSAPKAVAGRDRYLGMVFSGQPLQFKSGQIADITFDQGAPGPLGFPPAVVSTRTVVDTPVSGTQDPNAGLQQQLDVRRPCCVQLKAGANGQLPLVVLHAPQGPSDSRSPEYATLIALASQQLQGTEAILAGNLNVAGAQAPLTLLNYTTSQSLGYGANTYSGKVPAGSLVQYRQSSGSFQTGPAVVGPGLDYAFAKSSGTAPALSIRKVLELDIIATNGGIRAALTDIGDARVVINGAVAQLAGQQVADILDAFINGQPLPYGADNWTAAAIIHSVFISDHLPVVISFA